MKKRFLPLGLLSATLFLAAARADGPKTAPPTALDANQAALLRRYDLNHDGKLDEDELAAAHESMLKAGRVGRAEGQPGRKFLAMIMRRFDRNGDGRLDETERAEAQAYFLQRFDQNHDGRLDEEERAVMRQELRAEYRAGKLRN
jgi:Ca2+-binding EF-hand superfamily protein